MYPPDHRHSSTRSKGDVEITGSLFQKLSFKSLLGSHRSLISSTRTRSPGCLNTPVLDAMEAYREEEIIEEGLRNSENKKFLVGSYESISSNLPKCSFYSNPGVTHRVSSAYFAPYVQYDLRGCSSI